jgi:hypothetical protein
MRLIQFVQIVIPELDKVIGVSLFQVGETSFVQGRMVRLESGVASDNGRKTAISSIDHPGGIAEGQREDNANLVHL